MRGLVLSMLLLLALPVIAASRVITLEEYIKGLNTIADSLQNGDRVASKDAAAALKGVEIHTAQMTFAADEALLADVTALPPTAPPFRLQQRLGALTMALTETARIQRQTQSAVDGPMLSRLQRARLRKTPKAGGEIDLDHDSIDFSLSRRIEHFFDWMGAQLDRLLQWLRRLWEDPDPQHETRNQYVPGFVVGLVALVVLLLVALAFGVIRKSRRRSKLAVVLESDPSRSTLDDEPISRGMSEWEELALRLTAQERYREALRAWYHAVLVSLYQRSILYYRKGRTNWEYVASMSPRVAIRPAFTSMTRRFEREWYGHALTTLETCEEFRDLARSILEDPAREGAA